MDYVYDIVLNFQNKYYDFYEWQKSDKIINIKRLPIYKITNKDYLNLKYNDVTLDVNLLPKSSKMFLVTSGLEVMGLIIDNKGNIIKRSSLIFEESDDILNDRDLIKQIDLKYHINHIHKTRLMSRINQTKKQYINNCFQNLDKQKDEYFLKYLYYDIYNLESDDIDKIYDDLMTLSKKDVPKMYHYLNRVNTELKRQ